MAASVHTLRYLWQIWWNLPGSWEQKKPILCRVAACVRDFVSNHPRADLAAITARFGTPQQIAESSLENMETAELVQELNTRRKILRIVAITALVIVILWSICVGVAVADAMIDSGGTYVDEIEVIEHIVYEE